jgi:glutamate-1-semialdehyde 2,1-aminomutase
VSVDGRQPRVDTTTELGRRAKDVLAYGNQHRVLLRPLYEDERGVFPEFVESAGGYELVDSAGTTYVDWSAGNMTVLLGYRHPEVEEAIVAQLEAGPSVSLTHPVEVEVAELLTELVPCAEMVAFGKNGSDATAAAVRAARASTGRELILQFGFHGFHDWYTTQYRRRNAKGIPTMLRSLIHPFPYGDLDALERLFHRYPEEVAAVVMEPVTLQLPEPGYLESVLELAHANGALLVFDEMVTGFRLARGGAQELFGVTPDLACFGKALANGMPLSALVGRREYMRHVPDTAYGMTFRGETLSLAAAKAVLNVVRDQPVVEHVAAIGDRLRAAFHAECARLGIACKLSGPPARMSFVFEGGSGSDPEELKRLFLLECARNGVITTGTVLPTYAHDDEAVARTENAFRLALAAIGETLEDTGASVQVAAQAGFGPAGAHERNGGPSALPAANLDFVREQPAALEVAGWLLLEDGCADSVLFVAANGDVRQAERSSRPDVAAVFPDVPAARHSGFIATLPARTYAHNGAYEFTIRAEREGATVFDCRVVRRSRRSPDMRASYDAAENVLYL